MWHKCDKHGSITLKWFQFLVGFDGDPIYTDQTKKINFSHQPREFLLGSYRKGSEEAIGQQSIKWNEKNV
jgi:hypothetical protein